MRFDRLKFSYDSASTNLDFISLTESTEEKWDEIFDLQKVTLKALEKIIPPSLQKANLFYNLLILWGQENLLKASDLFKELYPAVINETLLGAHGRKLLSLKAAHEWVSIALLIAEIHLSKWVISNEAKEGLKIKNHTLSQIYETDLMFNPFLLQEESWENNVTILHGWIIERKIELSRSSKTKKYNCGVVLDMSGSMSRENIHDLYNNIQNLYDKKLLWPEPLFSIIYGIEGLENASSTQLQELDTLWVYTFLDFQEYLFEEGFLACKWMWSNKEREWVKTIPKAWEIYSSRDFSLHSKFINRNDANNLRSPSWKWVWCTPLYSRTLDLLINSKSLPSSIVLCSDGWSDLSSKIMWWEIEWTQKDWSFTKENRYLQAIVKLARLHDIAIVRVPYSTNKKDSYQSQKETFQSSMQALNTKWEWWSFHSLKGWEEWIDKVFENFETPNKLRNVNFNLKPIELWSNWMFPFSVTTTSSQNNLTEFNHADLPEIYPWVKILQWATAKYMSWNWDNASIEISGIPNNIWNCVIYLHNKHIMTSSVKFQLPWDIEQLQQYVSHMVPIYDVSWSLAKYYEIFVEQLKVYANKYWIDTWEWYVFASEVGEKWYIKASQDYIIDSLEEKDLWWYTPLFTSIVWTLANSFWIELDAVDFSKVNKTVMVPHIKGRGFMVLPEVVMRKKKVKWKQYKSIEWDLYKSAVREKFTTALKQNTETQTHSKQSFMLVTDGISTDERYAINANFVWELVGTLENPWLLVKMCQRANISYSLTLILAEDTLEDYKKIDRHIRTKKLKALMSLVEQTWWVVSYITPPTKEGWTTISFKESFQNSAPTFSLWLTKQECESVPYSVFIEVDWKIFSITYADNK